MIINCDIDVKLRIAGHGKHHIQVTTDEGDGMSIMKSWTGEDPKYYSAPKAHHYEEWASQLEELTEILRALAKAENSNLKLEFRDDLQGSPYYLPSRCKYSVWANGRNTGIIFSEPDERNSAEDIQLFLFPEIAQQLNVELSEIIIKGKEAWAVRGKNG